MPCKAGPDFNAENMTAMISEWQKLLTAEDLRGVWGYAPAADTNSLGDTDGGSLNGILRKLQMLHGNNGFKMNKLLLAGKI